MALMSKPYYPKLDLGGLAAMQTIRSQMLTFPTYLEEKDCPYDADARALLARMFAPTVVEREVKVEVQVPAPTAQRKIETALKAAEGGGVGPKVLRLKTSGVDLDGVSQEIQGLRQELQQLKMDSKGLQTADKIQIIKTRAGLVEKLVSMDEKTNNLKRNSLFHSTVMAILDDLIPQDRRMEFIQRIAPFAAEEA